MPTREELLKRLDVLLDDLPKPWADDIRAVAGDLVHRERERCAVIADTLSMQFSATESIATALRVAHAIRESKPD